MYCAKLRFGDGGRETLLKEGTIGVCVCVLRCGDERPSSTDGNAMPPAKFLRAFAKDDVRFRVPDTISLRLTAGRVIFGDSGRVIDVGEEVRDDRRERAPGNVRGGEGSWWSEFDSSRVNGDSRRRAMI